MAATLTGDDLQEVWNAFLSGDSRSAKHQLMLQYIGLVRYVLHNLSLPPSKVLNDEDFLQIGILGLNDALDRYDKQRGVKFETYAIPRIRGMILDEVRRADWLSRTARKRSQDYLQAADKLRSEYGREASQEEIRTKLNLSTDEYKMYLRAAAAATSFMSMGESNNNELTEDGASDPMENIPDESAENALTRITDEERISYLSNYLEGLQERQRLIMTLYYYKSLTFKEIGQVLKITESRVCQIHTSIIAELRKKLRNL